MGLRDVDSGFRNLYRCIGTLRRRMARSEYSSYCIYALGYNPPEFAILFVFYEGSDFLTTLFGGAIGARVSLHNIMQVRCCSLMLF